MPLCWGSCFGSMSGAPDFWKRPNRSYIPVLSFKKRGIPETVVGSSCALVALCAPRSAQTVPLPDLHQPEALSWQLPG